MTSLPWDAPANIVLPDGAELPPWQESFTLARAIQVVIEELPHAQGVHARIEFQGGILEGRAIATIYHSPQFPLDRRKSQRSAGGQTASDKRRHTAA